MKNSGLYLITFWIGFNLLAATGILAAMLLLGKNAPAIYILFSETEIQSIEPRALATISSLAVLCNGVIVAFCSLSLAALWRFHGQNSTWIFWAVSSSLFFVQLLCYASDLYLQNINILANLGSTAILALGIGLYGVSLLRTK